VAVIGTCLNIDDQAPVRVVVRDYAVKFECVSTEIDMDSDSLAAFIAAGEEALPQLSPNAGVGGAAVPDQPNAAATADQHSSAFRTSASTWVVCDADDQIWYLTVGTQFELHWGERLIWTISAGALTRLLERARRAWPILVERMHLVGCLPDDQEILDTAS
jgi:hypothetical protein